MSPTLRELESRCQKPQWRELGSQLARRFARPLALHVTWLLVRLPISANMVTAITFAVGLAAAVLLGTGSAACFVTGAVVLQVWYVLDHVDGQVARFRGSESVTGVYFDFMMHHIVHPAVAFAIGYGIAARTGELRWTLAGAAFAIGLAMLSLSNDCRYKAFFAEWKKGRERRAESGGPDAGGEQRRLPGRAFVCWLQMACEIPNVTIALSMLAGWVLWNVELGFKAVQVYLVIMATISPVLGLARLTKQVWQKSIDDEFHAFVDSSGTAERRPAQPDIPSTKHAA